MPGRGHSIKGNALTVSRGNNVFIMTQQFTISGDRVLTIFIACLIGFLVFKDVTQNNTNANSSELIKLKIEVQNLSELVKELRKFASDPRFTPADHRKAMIPVNDTLARHEAALTRRSDWMREREAKEREMFYILKTIQEKLRVRRGSHHPENIPLIRPSWGYIRKEDDFFML